MGDATCDARGVLRGWYENLRVDPGLTGWGVDFDAGGDRTGAGSRVSFIREPVLAELLAWPGGCVDTNIVVDGTDGAAWFEHVEVRGDRDLLAFVTGFTERLRSLATSVGRR